MKTTIRLISAFTFAMAVLSGFEAPALTITNFSTPSLTLNGSAASISNGAALRLTPAQTSQAGSAFLPVALSSNLTFSSSFQFLLSNGGGVAGADGLAFVLQAAGATALGSSGAGLGYAGITHSLAVDFDTHNSNHVAFNTNGTISDPFAISVSPQLNNSIVWHAWVDYNGASGLLELRLAQTSTRPATAILTLTNLNLAALLGTTNVFAGFTAGTGLGYNSQDVLAWTFTAPQAFLTQSITNFPAIGNHATSDTVLLSAAASSGLPVSFSVASGPGLITGGNTLTFTGPGQVSVVAAQAGNADWEPAPALTNNFQVKNSQTIAFAPIASQVVTNILKLNATVSSGLPITFTLLSGPAVLSNGTNLSFTAHGIVSVMASQAGDANNWPATSVTNTFHVYALYTLTVVSPFGTSIPGAGANVIVEGTTLTAQGLAAPTVTNGVVTQYLCLGWNMTGNAPFSGNLGSFTLTVTNNATLTWFYTTNVYFHDDFETGFNNWSHTGTWGIDSSSAVSPSHCASDSPGGYYNNNTDTAMSMSSAISLAGLAHPALHFWTKYDLEANYDFVYVEGSTNGGSAWFQIPGGSYTGTDLAWTEQQFDLATWGSATAFRVRFHIVTDPSVVKDGWYVDDVHIGSAPDPLTATPATTTANSVTLNWTPSYIGDFAAYRIYRSMDPTQPPWQNGILVGTITRQDTTTFVDTTVAPKTHYYYQIVVVNVGQLFAFSGVIPATTAIGMDYPFLDNGEAGGGAWVADAPWALATDDYVSPTHCWEDSPGANYPNGIAGQSLTLSSPMSFLTAVNPVLTFTHKYVLNSGTYLNVEASTNQGAGWMLLASYSGSSAGWIPARLALTNCAGQSAVLVRFRLTSSPGSANGVWRIDNISVTEGLATVNPVALDQVGANSVRLTWPANTQGAFSYYAVFHDTNAAVGINSPLAAIISNQNTATFTVTGLSPNTTHYFRVYAVNSYGGYSLDAAVPASTNTPLLTTPFTDNFEAATPFNFTLTGSWGLTTLTNHSGLQCLTDSPNGNYTPNGDDNAQTLLDLRLAQWPVLRFWDKYALTPNTRAAVQVNGTSMYVVNGTQTAWQPEAVDLSWWVGQANVPVQFRMNRWNSESADGWYLDDVSVTEQTPMPLSYPFNEGFENGLANWLTSTWALNTTAQLDGTYSLYGPPINDANVAIQQPMLSLAGWINLTNAVNPQLTFWWQGNASYRTFGVQVYAPGTGWTTLWSSGGNPGQWSRAQVSLASYVNQRIRVAFYTTAYYSGIWIDKIAVAEQAQPVTITNAVGGFKSVQLGWTPTASGSSFKRYEVWRGTSSGQEGLVAMTTNLNQTSLTDTNALSATTTYYYRVYTVDTNDMYAASVNETNTTTTQLAYPFNDNLNTLNQWITSGQWGLATNTSHSGTSSLTDSPNGNYTANTDDNAQTSLDLRLAQWPVLRFWDKYELTGNTRAAVQVNGTSMYVVNGNQPSWQPEAIDLSWWAGLANVPVQFRMNRWSSESADGWYLDDVSVTEQTPVPMSYPFNEGFENGLTNWLTSTWALNTAAQLDGTYSVCGPPMNDANVAMQQPMLSLAGWINLTNAVDPQLVFWWQGNASYRTFAVQVYAPGMGWTTLWSSGGNPGQWSRVQVSLASYVNRQVRLAFYTTAYYSGIWIDKIAVAEQAQPVTITNAVGGFKSVQLGWTPTASGSSFKRYEVWRGTSSGQEGLVAMTTNLNQTSLTDTNALSATTTYYYRVYVVDTNDIYVASVNETNTTTTQLAYPFNDNLNTLNQWITSGQWGLATNTSHSGTSSLTDSPNGNYTANTDDNAQTSLDLRLAQWPVLRFWDKYELTGNTRAAVQVNGTSMYVVNGNQPSWQPEAIDLSWWAGLANVPVQFRMNRWSSESADGWYLDDVSVTEQTPVPMSYPFNEGFENGLTNWLTSTWALNTAAQLDGTYSVCGPPMNDANVAMQQPMLSLAGWINLTNAVNPQLTFWWQGNASYRTFAVQVYAPGMGWTTLWSSGGNPGQWSRVQVSLASYVNRQVRLAFYTTAYYSGIYIDKIAVAEQAQPVTITNAVGGFKSVQLGWTPTASGSSFKRYEVWRGSSSGQEGLVAMTTNLNQTSLTDTNALSATTTYYYRVYVVDTNDIYAASVNETNTTTTQLAYPFNDNLDTLNQWITSGQWGLATNTSHSGTSSLTDSPNGNYTANTDDNAQTSLDLRLAQWPVLRFWDKYELTGNTRAAVQVNGTSMYVVNGNQPSWQPEAIDLSWWAGLANVPVQFRMNRWSSESADGWYLDDVSVTEQTPVPLSYPFFDGLEYGPGNWLTSTWALNTAAQVDGTYSMYGPPMNDANVAMQQPMLSLAGWINLTNAVDPQLVFWWQGNASYRTFGVQVYAPGMGWTTLWSSGGNPGQWSRVQVSLASYVNRQVRLAFYTTAYYSGIWIDKVGVGGIMPGSPTLASPPDASLVTALRPTLKVTNAVHAENFPLTYQFEVYSDAGLSNLVDSVPVVAAGNGTTSWPLDVNLGDNARYWWRSRAWYGTNAGPWMPTATFYVNSLGLPPLQVVLASPPNASAIPDTNTLFTWFAGVDPAGDYIQLYKFQVDSDPAFGSPKVNGTLPMSGLVDPLSDVTISVPLGSYAGAQNLQRGVTYYWRVQAEDAHGQFGAWSSPWAFVLGATINSFQLVNGANWSIQWSGPINNLYLEATPSLSPTATWSTVAGPLSGTSFTFKATNWTSGFYRLRSQ